MRSVTTLMWPAVAPLGLRAVVLAIRPAQDANDAALRPCRVLEKTDLGQLRIGIGHPGYGMMVEPDRRAEQRVADHQPGPVIGAVGVCGLPGDIAHRIDALVGGAQRPVEGNAARRVTDAGGVEIKVLDVRPAPCRDQKMRRWSPRPLAW